MTDVAFETDVFSQWVSKVVEQMIKKMGQTLVCSGITEDPQLSRQLLDATSIDRLNIGAVKTIALNWLQPHEGNIIDFLFRARAFQNAPPPAH